MVLCALSHQVSGPQLKFFQSYGGNVNKQYALAAEGRKLYVTCNLSEVAIFFFNPLTNCPLREVEANFTSVYFKLILQIDTLSTSQCEIGLK